MNYMKQVAEMLGVELDEEFKIEEYRASSRFKLTLNGGYRYGEEDEIWQESSVICDILNGNMNIVKLPKPNLNKKEKDYLSSFIKPFRNKVKHIRKVAYPHLKSEYIEIVFNNKFVTEFPEFETNTMYKGMETGKDYSLEELGL